MAQLDVGQLNVKSMNYVPKNGINKAGDVRDKTDSPTRVKSDVNLLQQTTEGDNNNVSVVQGLLRSIKVNQSDQSNKMIDLLSVINESLTSKSDNTLVRAVQSQYIEIAKSISDLATSVNPYSPLPNSKLFESIEQSSLITNEALSKIHRSSINGFSTLTKQINESSKVLKLIESDVARRELNNQTNADRIYKQEIVEYTPSNVDNSTYNTPIANNENDYTRSLNKILDQSTLTNEKLDNVASGVENGFKASFDESKAIADTMIAIKDAEAAENKKENEGKRITNEKLMGGINDIGKGVTSALAPVINSNDMKNMALIKGVIGGLSAGMDGAKKIAIGLKEMNDNILNPDVKKDEVAEREKLALKLYQEQIDKMSAINKYAAVGKSVDAQIRDNTEVTNQLLMLICDDLMVDISKLAERSNNPVEGMFNAEFILDENNKDEASEKLNAILDVMELTHGDIREQLNSTLNNDVTFEANYDAVQLMQDQIGDGWKEIAEGVKSGMIDVMKVKDDESKADTENKNKSIKDMVAQSNGMKNLMLISVGLRAAFTMLTTTAGLAKLAVMGLNVMIAIIPIIIVATIAAAILAFFYFYDSIMSGWDNLMNWFKESWGELGKWWDNLKEKFATNIFEPAMNAWDNLKEAFTDNIFEPLMNAWDRLMLWVKQSYNSLANSWAGKTMGMNEMEYTDEQKEMIAQDEIKKDANKTENQIIETKYEPKTLSNENEIPEHAIDERGNIIQSYTVDLSDVENWRKQDENKDSNLSTKEIMNLISSEKTEQAKRQLNDSNNNVNVVNNSNSSVNNVSNHNKGNSTMIYAGGVSSLFGGASSNYSYLTGNR